MQERIKRIVQRAMDEVHYNRQELTFRHDPLQGDESFAWVIGLWHKGKAIDFHITATEDSPDDTIKDQAVSKLKAELLRIGRVGKH